MNCFIPPRGALLAAALLAPASALVAQTPAVELRPQDHISILGNALADRLQHSGWLETLLHAQFPQHQLVVRNLAAAGDEVATWHRSQDFGSRDEWLTWTATDVIFAFYGFGEASAGPEGLEQFKGALDGFLKDTARQNYSGKGAPRVVLFSPIAQEKHSDPNIADPEATNANLKLYTRAMAEVAQANRVAFVDALSLSQRAYAAAKEPLTLNGHYLTDAGEKALAPLLFESLFGKAPAAGDLSRLRTAVLEKNHQWHQRYRTIDGYNVYGGRSRLAFTGKLPDGTETAKLSNNEVMQREMQQRDTLTANRDARLWATAQGRDLALKDENLPPAIPVGTNKPGDRPDLKHTFLSGEEAIAKMKVHSAMKVSLFADETRFPELVNPVQMAWDTRGRLWVACWPNYPGRTPSSETGDTLLVLEDTDHDGKADKKTVFLADLNGPTGFQFYKDGVLVMQAPDLWFARDTDGDGKADTRERILMGLDSADSHHQTNAMALEPGGAVYLSDGVFHRSQVEAARGVVRNNDGAIFRFEPNTGKFETYASYGFANPHGRVFDRWGNDIITDATGNASYFGPASSGRLDEGKHPAIKQFWARPSRPCPGTGLLSSRHFPEAFQGNFLDCNVISILGIFRVGVTQDGSGLIGETLENLVTSEPSDNPNFRPSQVNVGPDGALYFADWSNAIIGHMQHHLRDPNRDDKHGRIYRVTYEGRPLVDKPRIHGQNVEALLELLKTPEDGTRELAKVELGKHAPEKVVAAAKAWVAKLDPKDPEYEHHRLEGLWVHQWQNRVDTGLLAAVLESPEPRARAAAVRVLCYWRDRVPNALALLKTAATDSDSRVRLQAVRAASFFSGADTLPAVEIVHAALGKELDYYLEYTAREALQQLEKVPAKMILPQNPAALSFVLNRLTNAELAQAPAHEAVWQAQIDRKGIDPGVRERALGLLSKARQSHRVGELLAALERNDENRGDLPTVATELAKALVLSKPAELAGARAPLVALVGKARIQPVLRGAYAALIVADGKPDALWAQTATDAKGRTALLDSLGLVPDPGLRAKFHPVLTESLAAAGLPGTVRSAALKALPLTGPEFAKASFALLTKEMKAGRNRSIAARALTQLPKDAWSREEAAPVVESIISWGKSVSEKSRTGQDYVETLQVGQELAALLPPESANGLRRQLRALGVPVFVIKTVHEQMRYDTPRIVVEPGKPLEVIFENLDAMPHNLVFVTPGSRESVATAAQTMSPTTLDKKGRAYVPASEKILEASKIIEPGQKQTLKFNAPEEPGEYEYVCTFPGHWMIMWGKMVVTPDVDKFLNEKTTAAAANPASQILKP